MRRATSFGVVDRLRICLALPVPYLAPEAYALRQRLPRCCTQACPKLGFTVSCVWRFRFARRAAMEHASARSCRQHHLRRLATVAQSVSIGCSAIERDAYGLHFSGHRHSTCSQQRRGLLIFAHGISIALLRHRRRSSSTHRHLAAHGSWSRKVMPGCARVWPGRVRFHRIARLR